jgi:hypothetical protein
LWQAYLDEQEDREKCDQELIYEGKMIRMVTSITNLKCGVSSNQKIKRKQETC